METLANRIQNKGCLSVYRKKQCKKEQIKQIANTVLLFLM